MNDRRTLSRTSGPILAWTVLTVVGAGVYRGIGSLDRSGPSESALIVAAAVEGVAVTAFIGSRLPRTGDDRTASDTRGGTAISTPGVRSSTCGR